ncbi:hypothetical protein ASF69_18180 [Rhizobium sp. Leaf311]|nr:hypothetical protein ASF69_18180 [Rhizobium sp. Leaf311]
MKPIDEVGVDEAGNCPCATLHKNAFQAPLGKTFKYVVRIKTGGSASELYHIGAMHRFLRVMSLDNDDRRAAIVEQAFVACELSAAVDNDACWARPTDLPHRQSGVIILHGANANDDGIHQCATTMEVSQTVRPGYVPGVPAWGRYPAVQRLTDLCQNKPAASGSNWSIQRHCRLCLGSS